ncbi:hypothetical protein BS47DRAFT_299054 [Hydnum rufescens UP504]|uniref:Uncharacterized protein n=1 Tax=Hydnum rufescens UP504 TaxID=1448309 RepID=A0A9P6B702_9AGAM|nr:hypothetical protein BS47DRAFT_299054 [Hydnum rufescens UP504]
MGHKREGVREGGPAAFFPLAFNCVCGAGVAWRGSDAHTEAGLRCSAPRAEVNVVVGLSLAMRPAGPTTLRTTEFRVLDAEPAVSAMGT